MKNLIFLLALTGMLACAVGKKPGAPAYGQPASRDESAFRLSVVSADATYGYSQHNPVRVGGAKLSEGPANERRYLNALVGPNGEAIRYERLGSCCYFDTPNGFMGTGLLDKYQLEWDGMEAPLVVYLNMYDAGDLHGPAGLTIKP